MIDAMGLPLRRVALMMFAVALFSIAMSGCTDSFTVSAPYQSVWARSTTALIENGFEMVTVPDAQRLIPASDERTGRAWFIGGALPDGAGWSAPRVIKIVISPVAPAEEATRTVTVDVEKRDWVAQANVPDSEMRSRVVWILRQALEAPGAAPVQDPSR